jgi:NAD(P)-dependent dehydrogenase (short-subunit alcohol dehydrogenase family)
VSLGRFGGQVAFVTGGASGIGRAAACRLAREGAYVVVADVADADATATAISEAGGSGRSVRCDVSKEDEVREALAEVVADHGRLDIALNNAGVSESGDPVAEMDVDEWTRVLSVDLSGVWFCMKHELAQMKLQGSGAIVNTASIAGIVGMATHAAYAAAKHGVIGLTKSAALEYGHKNIRVNAICPGAVDTQMNWRGMEDMPGVRDAVARLSVLNRVGSPEEMAAGALWLASEEASFITGACLVIDGGWSVGIQDETRLAAAPGQS